MNALTRFASMLILAWSCCSWGFAQGVSDWDVPGPADWNVDDHWTSSFGAFVPTADFGDSARINNGGTAAVQSQVPNVSGLNVNNGRLEIGGGGSLGVLGDASIGPGGSLNLSGDAAFSVDFNLNNAGTLRVEGGQAQAQIQDDYDQSGTLVAALTGNSHAPLNVGQTARLSGTLRVETVGVTPELGQQWTLLEAGTLEGVFESVESAPGAELPRGMRFGVVYDQSAGTASLAVDNVLTLTVDRQSGDTTIANVLGDPIELTGYTLESPQALLSPSGWSSVASNGQAEGWSEANPTPAHLAELNLTGSRTLAVGDTMNLGSPYNGGATKTQDERVDFEYVTADGSVVKGAVEFVGAINDLVLVVDPETGDAAIRNLSRFIGAPEITGYSILSDSGSLTPGDWESYQSSGVAGEAWSEANPTAEHLSELNLTDSTAFPRNTVLSLGSVFDPQGEQDLEFEYLTAAGEVFLGTVEYAAFDIVSPGLLGDANGDGRVDLADFTALKDNFGTGTMLAEGDFDSDGDVDLADFQILKDNFGSVAVPEPACWLLFAAMGGFLLAVSRRH